MKESLGQRAARSSASPRSTAQARDFLYLGRGINYPVALEGALKLKEISYIHAEGYPAGEMKHGPIALINEEMPVVVLIPHDARLREDALEPEGGRVARRAHHRRHRRAVADELEDVAWEVLAVPRTNELPDADPADASRSSSWPTTSPSTAAPTSTSRATWPRASRSSRARGARQLDLFGPSPPVCEGGRRR